MEAALIVGIFTVLGVLLGYGLTELSARRREERAAEEQARRLRTMVSLEIEENLRLLWLFHQKVEDLPDGVDPEPLNMARRVIQVPTPSWSHRAWESQMPSVPAALTYREIRQVHLHHSRLERITAIRTQLEALDAAQNREWASRVDASGVVPSIGGLSRVFERNAPELWEEFQRTMNEVFEKGNPVPQEMETSREVP